VGKRRYPNPVILKIDAAGASKNGIDFFDRGEVVLSDKIPPEFIEPLG
jgi:RNA:NAD 2'-phosphotransferase (TPT1/KptA family)